MKRKYHCEESIKLFGESFDYVHQWLDAYAFLTLEDGTKRFDSYHRKKRHHLQGAEEIRKNWGDKAYEAAIRHIISDFTEGKGFKEGRDGLPENEQDYIKKGFY
ncbi:MAG: hypothetical protein ACOYLO_00415 [Ferruginibacter sp.]